MRNCQKEFTDRSRRPVRYANRLPDQIERLIVEIKKGKPYCGARKIRELLVRRLAGEVRIPAISTVHAVLDRHGLVKRPSATALQGRGHGAIAGRRAQRSVARSARGCHPYLRYKLLPMSPVWTNVKWRTSKEKVRTLSSKC